MLQESSIKSGAFIILCKIRPKTRDDSMKQKKVKTVSNTGVSEERLSYSTVKHYRIYPLGQRAGNAFSDQASLK